MIKGFVYKSIKRLLFFFFEKNRAISFEETVYSFFPSLAKEYCRSRQGFLTNERENLLKYTDLDRFKKVVVVGGGSIPFTALFWAEYFKSMKLETKN